MTTNFILDCCLSSLSIVLFGKAHTLARLKNKFGSMLESYKKNGVIIVVIQINTIVAIYATLYVLLILGANKMDWWLTQSIVGAMMLFDIWFAIAILIKIVAKGEL